ncbi:MAG: RNA polymerase sigma factor [Bacteroidota bacterium]
MEEKTDEQLMAQVKIGDMDKSSVLFDRYHLKIYNYFFRMNYNRDISQDLTQNTFHRMLKYRKSFNNHLSFKNWLYRIARNVFVDSVGENQIQIEKIEHYVSKNDFAENEQNRKADLKALDIAMQKLTNEQREIITMSRFQNIKYQEIAEILEISVPAVKVKMHRAMKKLREYYFSEN